MLLYLVCIDVLLYLDMGVMLLMDINLGGYWDVYFIDALVLDDVLVNLMDHLLVYLVRDRDVDLVDDVPVDFVNNLNLYHLLDTLLGGFSTLSAIVGEDRKFHDDMIKCPSLNMGEADTVGNE